MKSWCFSSGGAIWLLAVLVISTSAFPANPNPNMRMRESRKKVPMPAPAVPMARQEDINEKSPASEAVSTAAEIVKQVVVAPLADASSSSVSVAPILDTETGSVAPVGDLVEVAKPIATTVKTYIEGEILSTPNPLDPLPVIKEPATSGSAPVPVPAQKPAPVFTGVVATPNNNNNVTNSVPSGAVVPGTFGQVNSTVAPPPSTTTKKPEEEEDSSEEDQSDEDEAEDTTQEDQEDEEDEDEEDEEEEEEEEERARISQNMQPNPRPTIFDYLRMRPGNSMKNTQGFLHRSSVPAPESAPTQHSGPGLDAYIPGYVTQTGEVFVPIDTLEQAYPYGIIPDTKTQQGRLAYYAEPQLPQEYFYNYNFDGTDDETVTSTKANANVDTETKSTGTTTATSSEEEEQEKTPVRISSTVILYENKNDTTTTSAGGSEENESSNNVPSKQSEVSAEENTDSAGTTSAETGVKTEPESEEEEKITKPVQIVQTLKSKPPLQSIPATRPTNEDDEDEFNRRRGLFFRAGLYEDDGSYMNYYNNYPGHYNSYYEPTELYSDEYYL